jgi:hypothetical protein
MKTTHQKTFNGISVSLILEEFDNHVTLDVRVSRVDPSIGPEVEAWGELILRKYNDDPRPIRFRHPFTGQVATVWGDESTTFTHIETKPVDLN